MSEQGMRCNQCGIIISKIELGITDYDFCAWCEERLYSHGE